MTTRHNAIAAHSNAKDPRKYAPCLGAGRAVEGIMTGGINPPKPYAAVVHFGPAYNLRKALCGVEGNNQGGNAGVQPHTNLTEDLTYVTCEQCLNLS